VLVILLVPMIVLIIAAGVTIVARVAADGNLPAGYRRYSAGPSARDRPLPNRGFWARPATTRAPARRRPSLPPPSPVLGRVRYAPPRSHPKVRREWRRYKR